MFGLHFALRAGTEHRALRFGESPQIKLHVDNSSMLKYLEYTEDCSKNNPGGISNIKQKKKVVRAYKKTKRCVVKFYEQFVNAHPSGSKCPDNFYLRPLAAPKSDVWYSCQPMGHLKLSGIVLEMAKRANFQGKITNHSLRATSASCLYHANCYEQIVKEHTGHRSDVVRE